MLRLDVSEELSGDGFDADTWLRSSRKGVFYMPEGPGALLTSAYERWWRREMMGGRYSPPEVLAGASSGALRVLSALDFMSCDSRQGMEGAAARYEELLEDIADTTDVPSWGEIASQGIGRLRDVARRRMEHAVSRLCSGESFARIERWMVRSGVVACIVSSASDSWRKMAALTAEARVWVMAAPDRFPLGKRLECAAFERIVDAESLRAALSSSCSLPLLGCGKEVDGLFSSSHFHAIMRHATPHPILYVHCAGTTLPCHPWDVTKRCWRETEEVLARPGESVAVLYSASDRLFRITDYASAAARSAFPVHVRENREAFDLAKPEDEGQVMRIDPLLQTLPGGGSEFAAAKLRAFRMRLLFVVLMLSLLLAAFYASRRRRGKQTRREAPDGSG